jgi:hypothetical protein
VDLCVKDIAHIDDRAETLPRPALGLHRQAFDVVSECGHERRQPIDELGRGDESITPFRVPVGSQLGLVALHAGQLDGLERALPGGDVIGMPVPAVRSPDDHDLGSHEP